MEELKLLIKDEKDLLKQVDTHIKELDSVLTDLRGLRNDFTTFFDIQKSFIQRQEKFMDLFIPKPEI